MNYKLQKILLWIAVGIAFFGVCIDGFVADWIPRLIRCIGIVYIIGAWFCMIVDLVSEYKEKINVIYSSIIEEAEDEQREAD